MGLDNGLMVKIHNYKILDEREFTRASVGFDDSSDDSDEYCVCYWRKCWNVRDWLYESVSVKDTNEYSIVPMTLDEVESFFNKLLSVLYQNQWDEDYATGRTIWTLNGYKHILGKQLRTLDYLLRAVEKYEDKVDYQFYFYDSY